LELNDLAVQAASHADGGPGKTHEHEADRRNRQPTRQWEARSLKRTTSTKIAAATAPPHVCVS
jgi:hypothetical protein